MQLTLWTYEGPPHIGAMRVAAAMSGLHYVLHAPQGDTYADLLFTMIERRSKRPPVTYTTFQARDLGGDTANLFKSAVQDAYDRFQPQAILVGASYEQYVGLIGTYIDFFAGDMPLIVAKRDILDVRHSEGPQIIEIRATGRKDAVVSGKR